MHVLKTRTINKLIAEYPTAAGSLKTWRVIIKSCTFEKGSDVVERFSGAKTLGGGERVRFEIKGGQYRLIAAFRYGASQTCYIKFFGSHADYDKIDALTVDQFKGE